MKSVHMACYDRVYNNKFQCPSIARKRTYTSAQTVDLIISNGAPDLDLDLVLQQVCRLDLVVTVIDASAVDTQMGTQVGLAQVCISAFPCAWMHPLWRLAQERRNKHSAAQVCQRFYRQTWQVMCADLILLNKCDLIPEDTARSAEQSLANLTTAKIVRCTRGEVPLAVLMDVSMQVLMHMFVASCVSRKFRSHEYIPWYVPGLHKLWNGFVFISSCMHANNCIPSHDLLLMPRHAKMTVCIMCGGSKEHQSRPCDWGSQGVYACLHACTNTFQYLGQ